MGALRDSTSLLTSAVIASATAASRDLVEDDDTIRRPVLRCRRIAFVALLPASGCSTTAAGVAALLASRRCGRVLVVDGSGTESPAPRIAGVAPHRPGPERPMTPAGLYGLDVAAPGEAATVDSCRGALDPLSRFFEVIATDWGVRHPAADLTQVIATSDAVCFAVAAAPVAIGYAAEVAEVLLASGCPVPLTLALVQTSPAHPAVRISTRRRLPVPSAVVAFEPRRPDRPGTRAGTWRLAAALMSAAAAPEQSVGMGDRR